jgi:carboxyl-terminal processing protease
MSLTELRPAARKATSIKRWPSLFAVCVTIGIGGAFALGIRTQANLVANPILDTQLAQVDPAKGTVSFVGGSKDRTVKRDSDSAADATFDTVYSLLKDHYVDDLPADRVLSDGAVRSMLAQLNDPEAAFLEPDELAIFDHEAKGEYGGIGAALQIRPFQTNGYTSHRVVVVSPVAGSPALKAGLRPRDVITHIDGKWILGGDPFQKVNRMVQQLQAQDEDTDTPDVQRAAADARRRARSGIGLFRALMLLRGDSVIARQYGVSGTALRLTVERPGAPAPLTITVAMASTRQPGVSVRALSPAITLIAVPAFTETTSRDIARELAALPTDMGVVLDLRGNAGGVGGGDSALREAQRVGALLSATPDAAATFAIELLSGGRRAILKTVTVPGSPLPPHRLIALVNSGTAGAAEALAAQLSEAGRATLLGTATFGAPQIDNVYSLPDGAGFLLASGRLESSRGVDWGRAGLTPKVFVAQNATDAQILGKAVAYLAVHPHVAKTRMSSAPVAIEGNR